MRLYALLDPIVFTCNYRAKMDFLDLARFVHGGQFLYNSQMSRKIIFLFDVFCLTVTLTSLILSFVNCHIGS